MGMRDAARPLDMRWTRQRRGAQCDCPTGKSLNLSIFCPAPFAKIFPFALTPNHFYINASRLTQRGARDRHGRRCGMRWTRQRWALKLFAGGFFELVGDRTAHRREMLLRTEKSCGPDAPALASSWRSLVGPTGSDKTLIRKRR
jgi:hypothetical protein